MTEIPADLHHDLMRAVLHGCHEARRTGLFKAQVDANTAGLVVERIATALSEHYAGALIDPSTWTRVTATPQPMALGLFAAFMADDDEDWPDEPIYTLTREDDHADPA